MYMCTDLKVVVSQLAIGTENQDLGPLEEHYTLP